MKVTIVVTKTCRHCAVLQQYLKDHDISCDIKYLEDNPQLCTEHNISRSPNIMVDGEVIFRGMPSISELNEYFNTE